MKAYADQVKKIIDDATITETVILNYMKKKYGTLQYKGNSNNGRPNVLSGVLKVKGNVLPQDEA